jgi:hypothetical protein
MAWPGRLEKGRRQFGQLATGAAVMTDMRNYLTVKGTVLQPGKPRA